MTAYADTSFFVSLYLADAHLRAAEQLLTSGSRVFLPRSITPSVPTLWRNKCSIRIYPRQRRSKLIAILKKT